MDPPDPSHSPSRNYFDPTNLLGSSPFSPAVSAANPYAHLAHMPSAFSLLGRHPGFPGAPPFGGLGSLDPLRSPGSVLSPTTGGAEWWRVASDAARRAAGYGDVDYLVTPGGPGGAGPLPPPLGLLPPAQQQTGDKGSLYRPLEESAPKHLNGAYSSLFQLPTYTSAAAPTSTKSSASSSHDKHSHTKTSKSDAAAAAGSTPLSPPAKRSASPASSTSSHSSTSRQKEGSTSSMKGGKHRDSPKMKNGPGAAAMSKYDEEVAKSLSSMFAFPDSTAAMLAPSMFAAPPMFSYPYGAGALFAAHQASLYGFPMSPSPHSMPFSMAAMSPPPSSVVTSHSTTSPKGVSSSSSSVTKTTTATTTAVSSAVSKSSTPAGTSVSGSHKGNSDSDRKSRKNLFGGEPHHSRPEGPQSSSAAARTSDQQPKSRGHPKERPANHSSRKVRGASSDSDSLPDVSSDSLSDDSDLENDRESPKNKKSSRPPKMPELQPIALTTHSEDSDRARPSPSPRPPTPDLVQDLSMKKRPASVSSHTSSSSYGGESKKESHPSSNHSYSPSPHSSHHPHHHSKASTSSATSSSTSSSSSSKQQPPPLISSPTSYPMPMHSSLADMTAQHMESLFSGAGHLPPKLPMFFHPAAAMMAPMLDGSMSLLLPPPPSSAQAASTSGRSNRGRGRGRGSRSGGSAASSSGSGQRKGRGGGGGRSRVSSGSRGRSPASSTSSSSAAATTSAMDYAALSQLQVSMLYEQMYGQQFQEEHHQAALREHMEMQLKAHQQMAAMSMDPHHQMAALQMAAAQDSQKEATNKLHQLADAHAAASRSTSESKSTKSQSSKLANALMGQMPSTMGTLPKSYATSKHSEATSGDSEGEEGDSISDFGISASSASESDSDDSDMDNMSSQDSESASYTTQGSKRPGEESDGATPRKKRRTAEIDETEIRIPLEHGWRRQTRLRGIGSRGLIGEVVYFAPCGKKLKTVPDVARYLERNAITDLTRANFTFSTKVNVGDFLEAQSEDGNSGYVALTEEEVVERFMMVATRKRAKVIAKQERAERRRLRKQQAADMAHRMAEMKMAKKVEQQEMTRRIAEMKMRRKMERQQAREAARREKQMRAVELKKMKERERLMRQQEKVQRQEQMRIEREMRAQQIMEEKQRRKDELQRRLYEDALQKAKDREMKRQQAVMMKEQAGPAVQSLSLDGTLFGSPSAAQSATRGHYPASAALALARDAACTPSRLCHTTTTTTTTSASTTTPTSAPTTTTTSAAAALPSGGSSGRRQPTAPRATSGGSVSQYGPYTELLYQSVVTHAARQEQERRKQMMVMVSLERERRRQHMLLVKALEARKRHEERERTKEEKRNKSILERDRKMEQRRIEMEMARELRKPVEDMLLNNHQEMPKIERLPGLCLAGEAFSDCLMVIEFLHNFGTALGFDDESLPTIQELHSALLNDEDEVEEFVTVVTHLLKFAIDDPGFPNPKEAVTVSGLKVTELEVTEENMSEVLRIFVRARNGKEDEMTDWLLDKPLLSLTPTQKAACLAFLCNELLSSKSIYGEIEKNIETLGNLRKDKWMAEGKVRKLRMMQAKKLRAETKAAEMNSEAAGSKKGSEKGSDDEEDGDKEDDDNESGNESDVTNATGNVSDEDEEMSLEELEKKIEKLNKQQINYDRKANDCTTRLRATDFGQDRYKRRYWVLPKAGGVFIEGLESAEMEEEPEVDSEEEKEEEKEKAKEGEESKDKEKEEKPVNGEVEKAADGVKVKEEETSATEVKNDTGEVKMDVEPSKDETVVNSCNSRTEKAKTINDSDVDSKDSVIKSDKGQKLVNGVKDELMETDVDHEKGTKDSKDLLLDSIHKNKMENLKNSEPMEQSQAETIPGCVKVELNGKRSDEAVIAENGEVKAENGLDLVRVKGEEPMEEAVERKKTVKEEQEKCLVNGSPSKDEQLNHAFKVPSSTNLLLAKAESGNSKLGDVLGTPPAALHSPAHHPTPYSTPPPSSLDIFKTAQNNNYCIPNSHAEIASSFRSIDSILGSPDHKSTPTSSGSNTHPAPTSTTPASSSSPALYNSSFLSPQNVLSSTPVSAEQMLKTLSQRGAQDTWFSILPRMPCDESSLTRCGMTPQQQGGGAAYASPSHCSMYGYPGSHRGSPIDFHYNMDRSSLCNTPGLSGLHGEGHSMNLGEVVDKSVYPKAKPIPKAMQRGWWRITSAEQLQTVLKCLHTRGVRERCLKQNLERYLETGTQAADMEKDLIKIEETELSQEIAETKTGAPEPDSRCGWSEEECAKAETAALEEVEDLEERVFGASLQVKGCPLPYKVSEDDESATRPKRDRDADEDDDREPLEQARERLLSLEKNIERRYLKPPLAKGVQINLANLSGNTSLPHDDSDGDEDEEDLPAALIRWREAAAKAVSAAQLHLCLYQLNKCIAWEKSIMKVSCQICCKDDNEAELLLCDSCDKGYHTYCFRPKMEDIPEGDWYCCACISKATGEPTCVVCCKKGPKIASCDHCSYAMHIECMDPPLPRVPRRYACYTCASTKNKGKKRSRKPPPKVPPKETAKAAAEKSPEKSEPTSQQPEPPTPEKEKKGKKKQEEKEKEKEEEKKEEKPKEKEPKKTEKKSDKRKGDKSSLRESSRNSDKSDLTPCRTLLAELERHEEAWPFLQPVNHKQFPTYRKVIKHAMDMQAMKHKLRDSVYKLRDEFAADARLMFNNCQIFNEDESEVGQAGFILRSFFEKRWKELGCSS